MNDKIAVLPVSTENTPTSISPQTFNVSSPPPFQFSLKIMKSPNYLPSPPNITNEGSHPQVFQTPNFESPSGSNFYVSPQYEFAPSHITDEMVGFGCGIAPLGCTARLDPSVSEVNGWNDVAPSMDFPAWWEGMESGN